MPDENKLDWGHNLKLNNSKSIKMSSISVGLSMVPDTANALN